MNPEAYGSVPFDPAPVNGSSAEARLYGTFPAVRHRYWLHILLFLITLFTTTCVGVLLARSFHDNRPFAEDFGLLGRIFREPSLLWTGLPFSLTLLGILLAHEMGHYLACVHYGIRATLPYFLPGPTFIGTLGAFIRIKSPIYSKRVLFDVGVAGPLAGFLALLPPLAAGLAYSKVTPGIAQNGDLLFGRPLVQWLLEAAIFPGVPHMDIYLHPVARAAWVGVFATALNLLPIGQLDGGHILYAFAGERYRLVSRLLVAAMIPMGFLYWPWWGWAAFLFFFGLQHPTIYDSARLSPGRKKLAWLSFAILVLSFMPVPIRPGM